MYTSIDDRDISLFFSTSLDLFDYTVYGTLSSIIRSAPGHTVSDGSFDDLSQFFIRILARPFCLCHYPLCFLQKR